MANFHRHACLVGSLSASTEKFRRYLTQTAVEDCITIAVRPHVLLPDLGAEVMLRRDVIVTMSVANPYSVSWMPSDHGPFPRLSGEVHLVEDSPDHSRLVLMGDMMSKPSRLRHRFNQAIAKELLVHLARQMA